MEWTRSETLALASNGCTLCHGVGLIATEKRGKLGPCACVLRAIFRACYARFRECARKEKHISQATLQFCESGKSSRRTWGWRDAEYMADFCLIAKRELDATEHKVFRMHFLLGADWRLCCRQLQMDRGSFFHMIYRIQQKLGRVFRELEPFALFPLDVYFRSCNHNVAPTAVYEDRGDARVLEYIGKKQVKLEPPLRQVA